MRFISTFPALLLLLLTASVVALTDVAADEPSVAGGTDDTPNADYLAALDQARKIEQSLVDAVRDVRFYSVSVLNKRLPKGAAEPRLAGVGSGVLVRYRGKLWIVTNVHVIQGADALEVVTHDGVVHPVETHDTIPAYDIALLKFSNKTRGYKGVTLKPTSSKSDKKLREGTWVIATGNPFFLALDGRSVTTLGVVSGKERFLGGKFQYVDAIQHDTEVNPGNSGGPLWNLAGDLVGINGKIATTNIAGGGPSNTGASFSLPVHQVDEFLPMLTREGDAKSAYLGVQTETVTDSRGRSRGARILKIERGSPLNKARAKKRPVEGDIITKIVIENSTKRIYTAKDLRNLISVTLGGAKVKLFWMRGRKQMTWKGQLPGR